MSLKTKFLLILLTIVIFFFGITLFGGSQICPFGEPVDNDNNGVPENCFVSS